MLLKVQGFNSPVLSRGLNQNSHIGQSNVQCNPFLMAKSDNVSFGNSMENKLTGSTFDILKWVADAVKKSPLLQSGPNKGFRVYAGTLLNGIKHEIKMLENADDVVFKLAKPDYEDVIFTANSKTGILNKGHKLSPAQYNEAVEYVHNFFWLGKPKTA